MRALSNAALKVGPTVSDVKSALRALSMGSLFRIADGANIEDENDSHFGGELMITLLKKYRKDVLSGQIQLLPRTEEQPESGEQTEEEQSIDQTINEVIREGLAITNPTPELDLFDDPALYYLCGYLIRRRNLRESLCVTCLAKFLSEVNFIQSYVDDSNTKQTFLCRKTNAQ